MKKKIIDSDPAPYPANNTREIQAVISFVGIIDLDRIKPDVKFFDKVPNTDGIIDIVNESQIPKGRIDVQIKVLEKKNYKKPKYQCEKKFLSYCENSILPVLLIVVNPDDSVAYWHHMDRATIIALANKMKGESVNLDFKHDNIIKKGFTDYVDDWIKIIELYQEKLLDSDSINERSKQLNDELDALKSITNTAVGKKSNTYKEVHTFLDHLNGLLDSDFKTIKNILYPDIWKLGCGLYKYEKNHISFSLYPIPFDLNDVLIKQFDSQDQFYVQNVLSYIGHNYENPIKNRPKMYSYELIKSDTEKILESQTFLVKDKFLAEEYVLAFIDKFYAILGLEFGCSQYNITDVEYALNTFLPLWIEQVSGVSTQQNRKSPTPFVIDYIFLHTYPKDIDDISAKVKAEIKNGNKPSADYKIISNDFNFLILQNLLAFLKQIGAKSIEREYEIRHEVNKSQYYTWEAWGEEKTTKNIIVFYNHFIRIYDMVVHSYFQELYGEIQFYNDFNHLVIIVDFLNISNYSTAPSIEYYYLNSNDTRSNTISIYNSKDQNVPIKREALQDLFANGVTIEGIEYSFLRCQFSALNFIYKKTPILDSIKSLLKIRFEEYFKNIGV